MKAKFALLLLPAFMALTSCGFKPAVNDRTLLEDTTAHSKVFGNRDVFGGQLAIKKRAGGEAITEPKIGYQISYNSSTDKLAIRFVAALKEFNVRAYWRRGVAASTGSTLQNKKFSDATQESEQYYVSLSDGNKTITAGVDEYAGYAGFVVYTIHNIPYSSNENVYVAAYVNLVGDAEGDTSDTHNNSKGLAVKIEKKDNYTSANAFAFNPTTKAHFLQGTVEGTLRSGDTLLYATEHDSGDNVASYSNLHLLKTDSFGSFYYKQDETFEYFGHKSYFEHSKDIFRETGLSGYSAPFKEGYYDIYVSRGQMNKIYYNVRSTSGSPSLFFHPGVWEADGAEFAIYMWGDGVSAKWAKLESKEIVRGKSVYKYDLDTSTYSGFKFTRMKGGTAVNDYSFSNPPCWDQINSDVATSQLTSYPYNMVKITSSSTYSWWHYWDFE